MITPGMHIIRDELECFGGDETSRGRGDLNINGEKIGTFLHIFGAKKSGNHYKKNFEIFF